MQKPRNARGKAGRIGRGKRKAPRFAGLALDYRHKRKHGYKRYGVDKFLCVHFFFPYIAKNKNGAAQMHARQKASNMIALIMQQPLAQCGPPRNHFGHALQRL